jgi:hypothetical protein
MTATILRGEVAVKVDEPGSGFEERREAVAGKLGIDPDHIAEVEKVNDD